jgi:deoxyribose-phosphate aldolase
MSAGIARRALGLVDLTSLNDDDDAARIAALCDQAVTPAGPVAAVCVYPPFVAQAKAALAGTGVRVATVANFPSGATDVAAVRAEAEGALLDGADEVDVVLPYAAYQAGDRASALAVVDACRAACGSTARLKVILESGALEDPELIHDAAADALAHGADFVKTSTGKREPGATLAAAEAMLTAILEAGGTAGFKASGGIKTTEQAGAYLELADRLLGPDYVAPERFRFGASSLLGDLLGALGHQPAGSTGSGY